MKNIAKENCSCKCLSKHNFHIRFVNFLIVWREGINVECNKSSSINQFHFLHGAIFSLLVRNDKPISLILIGNDTEKWSKYRINDEIYLYIKSSRTPKSKQWPIKGTGWDFSIDEKMVYSFEKDKKENQESYVALVCTDCELSNREITLLDPLMLEECIEIKSQVFGSQTITVLSPDKPRTSLRVWGTKNGKNKCKIIPRDKFKKWDIPGK